MSERKAVYIVGNIYHVDFGQFNFQIDGDSHEPIVYGMSHSNENTRPIYEKVDLNTLDVIPRDTQE